MQRNPDELAFPGRATTTLTCTSPHFLPSKEISRADLALVSQRLAAVRLIACVAIETQRKNAAAIHMPARSPHAAGDWIDRAVWPHAGLIRRLQKPACQRRRPTQRRRSNKQSLVICANFERGLFKNAAHPPVDDVISKSQN
jgi:hypothetical protein